VIFGSLIQLQPFVAEAEPIEHFFGNPEVPDVVQMNWTRFWQVFNKHSTWDLEVNMGGGWFSVKADLKVIKSYVNESVCKISLDFTSSYAGDYRLTFAIDKRVENYVYKAAQMRYVLEYADYSVFFDWSDMKSIPQLQFSHGVTQLGGQDVFWFRVRRDNVPQGMHVVLDPNFGYESEGASTHSWTGGDDLAGCVFTSPNAGKAMKIVVWLHTATDVWQNYKCAIYKDSDLSYVGGTEEVEVHAYPLFEQVDFSFSEPYPELEASTDYILCVWGEGDYVTAYQTTASYETCRDIEAYNGFPSAYVKNDTYANEKMSIYCSYSRDPTIGEFEAPTTVKANE